MLRLGLCEVRPIEFRESVHGEAIVSCALAAVPLVIVFWIYMLGSQDMPPVDSALCVKVCMCLSRCTDLETNHELRFITVSLTWHV